MINGSRIILLADAGLNHRQIAGELKMSLDMARTWRHRWLDWTYQGKVLVA